MLVLVLKHFLSIGVKALYKHCLPGKSTIVSLSVQLNPASIYICGIPASSSAVEYLSSIAGIFFMPDRCQLADNTFHKLIFIRCNKILSSLS